jgi:hypothetical protein
MGIVKPEAEYMRILSEHPEGIRTTKASVKEGQRSHRANKNKQKHVIKPRLWLGLARLLARLCLHCGSNPGCDEILMKCDRISLWNTLPSM